MGLDNFMFQGGMCSGRILKKTLFFAIKSSDWQRVFLWVGVLLTTRCMTYPDTCCHNNILYLKFSHGVVQVRVIQQDRNDEKSGVHPQFRRSDALLKVLKDEYISLKKDLKVNRKN